MQIKNSIPIKPDLKKQPIFLGAKVPKLQFKQVKKDCRIDYKA